ncbi:uncharacterized protein BDR25DRAFT_338800 [Lindgomyces ingoldianus]|uniref:Uncharacterized protein n=1 Tax=Lindgomyces ingoldianus TaxID=673940 RepID=A0ACB6RFX9_9PLEO|nr:uncharacterized protein BDR25DRAFT_338800 [Lindgomyces ingoldianus]KAF2478154.1 hypothetical protein BDR25DRAFT_338800 [Lindgomyces ingoldianus]
MVRNWREVAISLSIIPFLPTSLAYPATITPPPRILLRDGATLGPEVIGYTSTFGTYSIWHCPVSSIWSVVGSYGRCCTDNTKLDCWMPTTCEGSVYANNRFRSTCTGDGFQQSCVTGTIYASIGDPSPISNYQCWPSWTNGDWAATRSVPLSSSTPSPSPTSSPILSTNALSPILATSSSTATSSGGSGEGGDKNGKLAGKIAGPIGGVIALSCICAFIIIRSKSNKKKMEEKRRTSTVYVDRDGNELHIVQKGHWSERVFAVPSTSPVGDGSLSPNLVQDQHYPTTQGVGGHSGIEYPTRSGNQ